VVAAWHGARRQKRDDFSDVSLRGERSPKIVVRQRKKENQMSHKLEIKIEDECAEVKVDQSVFTVGLDKLGWAQVPESVIETIPSYMREVAEKIIFDMKNYPIRPNETHTCGDVHADHQAWCVEARGLGMCNCNPCDFWVDFPYVIDNDDSSPEAKEEEPTKRRN
jgi:hypothetical protein